MMSFLLKYFNFFKTKFSIIIFNLFSFFFFDIKNFLNFNLNVIWLFFKFLEDFFYMYLNFVFLFAWHSFIYLHVLAHFSLNIFLILLAGFYNFLLLFYEFTYSFCIIFFRFFGFNLENYFGTPFDYHLNEAIIFLKLCFDNVHFGERIYEDNETYFLFYYLHKCFYVMLEVVQTVFYFIIIYLPFLLLLKHFFYIFFIFFENNMPINNFSNDFLIFSFSSFLSLFVYVLETHTLLTLLLLLIFFYLWSKLIFLFYLLFFESESLRFSSKKSFLIQLWKKLSFSSLKKSSTHLLFALFLLLLQKIYFLFFFVSVFELSDKYLKNIFSFQKIFLFEFYKKFIYLDLFFKYNYYLNLYLKNYLVLKMEDINLYNNIIDYDFFILLTTFLEKKNPKKSPIIGSIYSAIL